MTKNEIFLKINEYKDLYDFKEIIPISALKNKNIEELIKTIKTYLKDEIKYFEDGIITNRSIKFMIGEIIREKILNLTKEEVPHSVTCTVEKMKNSNDKSIINAVIIVDRDSLKKIIIGKNGTMIKKIGSLAREDIEKLLNTKVYLELYVKTIEKWRDREKYLNELEFNDFLN